MATNPAIAQTNTAVTEQISNANDRASTAANESESFLAALRDSALATAPSIGVVTPGNISISIPGISAVAPSRPTTAIDAIKNRIAVPPPLDFATTTITTNFPELNEKTIIKPTVSLPDAPTFTTELSAEKPTIAEVINANAPTESVPDKITGIGTYNIPSPPSVTIADFGDAIPAYTLSVPDVEFSYVEPIYSSALKDALGTKLLSDVENGGTGLSEEVEDAIWERTRERDKRDYDDAKDKLDSAWSGKNFSLPDGVLTELRQSLIVDARNLSTERSRDILIKQAELAQANTHFAITSSLSLEQLELNHANEVNNRALESAKSIIEFAIAFHGLKIADYNIQLERAKIQAVEQGSRLEAEKLRLEAYRVEMLEVQAKSGLDKDRLAGYNLDLERYNNLLKLFSAEQGAVATALGIEGLKIDFYKENINDHKARLDAQRNQALLFEAQTKGELGKVQVYVAELDAEKTRVGTLVAQGNLEIAKLESNVKLQDLELRGMLGNIEAYKATVSVANIELSQEAIMYGHDVDKFRAEVGRDAASLNIGVETLIKGRALDLQNTNIRLENAKANLGALLSTANLRLEAAKGIAGAYASITSAVMSGFSSIASIESGGLSTEEGTI
jgi:hypothetical protein